MKMSIIVFMAPVAGIIAGLVGGWYYRKRKQAK